ncbi:amino acid ABC transporter [Klebsiella variicola]|nr:amino acid ABC transporter [Klebsiella variicola]
MHGSRTLRKIPRLSAILHFYAISQNKYSGTAIFTSGMQWKETGPERPDRPGP